MVLTRAEKRRLEAIAQAAPAPAPPPAPAPAPPLGLAAAPPPAPVQQHPAAAQNQQPAGAAVAAGGGEDEQEDEAGDGNPNGDEVGDENPGDDENLEADGQGVAHDANRPDEGNEDEHQEERHEEGQNDEEDVALEHDIPDELVKDGEEENASEVRSNVANASGVGSNDERGLAQDFNKANGDANEAAKRIAATRKPAEAGTPRRPQKGPTVDRPSQHQAEPQSARPGAARTSDNSRGLDHRGESPPERTSVDRTSAHPQRSSSGTRGQKRANSQAASPARSKRSRSGSASEEVENADDSVIEGPWGPVTLIRGDVVR